MSLGKNNRHTHLIALCCICLFILGFSNIEDEYSSAMEAYKNKDFAKAFQAFHVLAEKNYAKAQLMLSEMYYNGEGTPKDYKQTIYWHKKSIGANYIEGVCEFFAGLVNYNGTFGPKDYKKAAFWFKEAAKISQNAEAEYMLGQIYCLGQGVPKDYKQAFHWYTESAEKGNPDAQFMLGLSYFTGRGVPKDYKQAVHWFTEVAEKGNADAQFMLGTMYDEGKGVPQNYTYSYVWFNLAASQGDEKAIQFRDQAISLLSPQQLAQAQDLAAEIQYKINHPDNPDKTSPPPNAASTSEPQIKGSGTGFIITGDGYLLTCLHVIQGAKKVEVAVGDDIQQAKVIRTDTNNDLALLKISGIFNALSFSPKRTAAMGEEVFTIGYPNPDLQGLNPKLTNGTINSLTGFKDDLRLYQISIPVQPGNSGGPLFDDNGNIYGVIVAMLDAEITFKASGSLPQNVNYAVKSTYAQAMLDTLPEVAEKLPSPVTQNMAFDEAVKRVGKSIVMVLAYK
ncbi:MAG: hypothetical protein C4518_06495 [Desulfobacteraceae bacterium]|nr:MAG: hypothetical protein C4518_06495 [Desulfobacteraceae bacterium]